MLPSLKYHSVIQTDANGIDYTSNVLLSDREAKERIVDGRLISQREAYARRKAELWRSYKWGGETSGRMPTERETELINYKNQEKS